MSNAIPGGRGAKGRKSNVPPDGPIHMTAVPPHQMPNGGNIPMNPQFATPHVTSNPGYPMPDNGQYDGRMNTYSNTPTLRMPQGTKITQERSNGMTGMYSVQKPSYTYDYPNQQHPHHQQMMNYEMYQTYPPMVSLYYPNPPEIQQPPYAMMGMPPMMQPAAHIPPVQPPQAPVPPAQPPSLRTKKVLLIVNPETNVAINQHEVDLATSGDGTPATAEKEKEEKNKADENKKNMQAALKMQFREQIEKNEQATRNTQPQPTIPQTQTKVEEPPATVVELVKKEPEEEVSVPMTEGTVHVEEKSEEHIPALASVSEKAVLPSDAPSTPAPETPTLPESPVDGTCAPTPVNEEEDAEERKEDAEEQKVADAAQKEAELVARLEAILARGDDVNEEKMVYGRDFLYCVRDIEKELKVTPCPLSGEQMVKLGLDRLSASVDRENNKKTQFVPAWVQKTRNDKRPYSGRASEPHRGKGGMGNRKIPPTTRQSIDRPAIDRNVNLHKAANAWKADKVDVRDDSEEAQNKLLLKNVRALFNKITPTTSSVLTDEFLSFEIPKSKVLDEVIGIIFDKAVEEPKFCPLYSDLCYAQVSNELKGTPQQSVFRNSILTRAQITFNTKTHDEEVAKRTAEIEAETDPKKKVELQIELLEAQSKFRRRKFGNITFIGQLYLRQLLSDKVLQYCLSDLIGKTDPKSTSNDEESIACAVSLLETIGSYVYKRADNDFKKNTDSLLSRLESLRPVVSNRIKFMIMHLLELKKNNWKQRKTVEAGPKKLDEIKKDIEHEQMQNMQQRETYERKQSRTGGPPLGSNPKKSIIGRSSLDNRQANPTERRAKAAQASLLSSSQQLKDVSLKGSDKNESLSRQKKWGAGGAVGGGTNNNRIEERSALPSARLINAHRSSSQGSVNTEASEAEGNTGANSEEEKEKPEDLGKIVTRICADMEECVEGVSTLDEVKDFIFDIGKEEKFGKPPVDVIFRCFMKTVVQKAKPPTLKKYGQMLALCMQLPSRPQILAGVASYCKEAVEESVVTDFPTVWSKCAEVFANAVVVEEGAIEGEHASINHFAAAFLEASKDSERPFQLLVTTLLRFAQLVYSKNKQDYRTVLSFTFEELEFLKDLDEEKLNEELKNAERVDGCTLFELYRH